MTASIIDIHAHFYPRRYLELIAEEGAPFGASCALCAPDGPVVKVGTLIAGPLVVAAPKFQINRRARSVRRQ